LKNGINLKPWSAMLSPQILKCRLTKVILQDHPSRSETFGERSKGSLGSECPRGAVHSAISSNVDWYHLMMNANKDVLAKQTTTMPAKSKVSESKLAQPKVVGSEPLIGGSH
jgi:hypothetical protein